MDIIDGMNKIILVAALVASVLAQCPAEAGTKFPGKGEKKDWARATRVYDQAIAARKKNQTADAVRLYEEAISIYPYDGDFYYNLAIHYARDKKNYPKAEELIGKAVELSPKDYSFHFEQAAILIEQNKLDAAKTVLASVDKLKKTDEQQTEFDSIMKQIDDRLKGPSK